MRVWKPLLAYLGWVFIGAAVLAPALWGLAHAVAAWGAAPWADRLADHPFHRYVSRCLQVLALAGVYPFARALGCRGWADLGWRRDPQVIRHLAWGLCLGGATVVVGGAVEGMLGLRTWREDLTVARVAAALAGGTLAGLAVGLAEETLFRGLLLGALQRVVGVACALAVSSLLYAALHFLERGSSPPRVGPWSGFEAIAQMFAGFGSADRLMPRFAMLLAAGVALGWMFLRTRSLAAPVALHGMWVVGVKLRGALTVPAPGAADARASDWVAFGAMLLALAVAWRFSRVPGPAAEVGGARDAAKSGEMTSAGRDEIGASVTLHTGGQGGTQSEDTAGCGAGSRD